MALSQAAGLLADAVAPLRYAVRGGRLAGDLHRYKSDRFAGTLEAAAAAARLREMLAAFMAGRGNRVWRAAGMPAGPSAVAVVPSGQGRLGVHPLAGLVRSCVDLPLVRLAIAPEAIHARGVNAGWVRVGDPVAGADVLVVDDTWVSGGSAQSVAAALKLAGARRVAVVVLGRYVNPADPKSAAFLEAVPGADDRSSARLERH
jgi:phosphoribosylpyrophosphate synthetase